MNRDLKRIDDLYNTIFENKKMVMNEADISGIDELVYNPATKKGGTVGFGFDGGRKVDGITWGGHNDHLHIGFTNRDVAMEVIDKAHNMGLKTTENPYAKRDPNGKVDNVHTDGSFHYKTFEGDPPVGAGVDISGDKDKITELIKWTVDKYSEGNYTVDPTKSDSTDGETSSETNDTSKEKSSDTISYGGKGSSYGSDPELYKAAMGVMKMIGIKESFGQNISSRYGTVSIPGSSNSVIKSPVDGVVNNMKKISGCKNQITIESADLGYFLQYCGVTNPTVRDGDSVSEGQVIGKMKREDNAEVLLLNRSYHRENLNTKEFEKSYSEKKSKKKKSVSSDSDDDDNGRTTKSDRRSYTDPAMASLILAPFEIFKDRYDKKTGELKQKRYAETGSKKQTDPWVIDAIKSAPKKVANFFRKGKNEQHERLKEDIDRIKKLLK